MSIQIARSGEVIHSLESIEELRAEIRSGRVLPTDHFHMPGMPDWRLVSTLPEPPRQTALTQSRDVADADSLIAYRRVQIRELIQQPANPKPELCRHCGAAALKSAKLVWQQSTRVGGAIDTNLDVTVFGSSSLQGIDVAPPTEPSVPGPHSGSFLTMVVSLLIMLMIPGMINIAFITFVMTKEAESGPWQPGVFARVLMFFYLVGIFYLGFLAARKFYRWDARRGLLKVCEVELARARAHLHWRNTWICTSCGAKTIARSEV